MSRSARDAQVRACAAVIAQPASRTRAGEHEGLWGKMSINRNARRQAVSGLAVGAVLVSSLVGAAAPASADTTAACGVAKKAPAVNVTRTLARVDDYGWDGHIWALDTFDEHIQIWQVASRRYCIHIDDAGTFSSFAGASPNSTGTISAGVNGTWTGTIEATVTGDFAPVAPTRGNLGTTDAGCRQDGTCATPVRWPKDLYFPGGITDVDYATFSATFDGGSHGTWMQTLTTSTGDITG